MVSHSISHLFLVCYRSASAEPFTPFSRGGGSITELSKAPFLSTPVSVRKLRCVHVCVCVCVCAPVFACDFLTDSAPLYFLNRAHPSTAKRLHPLVTPTPRSRPATPLLSHTHQRFVSHVQSFRDRMTSMLSQSGSTNLGVSAVHTPVSRMSVMQKVGVVLKGLATPTILL